MRRHLILIAETYPFSGAAENTFIDPEIQYLLDAFATVVVAPERIEGMAAELDPRLSLDTSLAAALKKSRLQLILRGCLSMDFLRELTAHPWLLLRWEALGRMALFIGRALIARDWAELTLAARGLRADEVVIYLFWFFQSAYGCSLLKQRIPGLKVVSRAHGADLYEARHSPRYIPFRSRAVRLIDAVFPDSEAGLAYLTAKWPDLSAKFATARLGVVDPGYQAQQSNDGVLRVVSCSSLTAVKRVSLIAEGLAQLVSLRPELRVEWNHFGSGPLRDETEALARQRLPERVCWQFHGQVPKAALTNWYREHPVDVFINVSVSEGTPVSIMEAISCGIPVIATGVGGNCEIVEPLNGVSLPPEPTALEVARALEGFAANPATVMPLRGGSRLMWQRKYAAATNFPLFIAKMQGITPIGQIDAQQNGCESC